MNKCPECGETTILIMTSEISGLPLDAPTGNLSKGKLKAECYNTLCQRKLWWFPWSKKVTRRNVD